MANARLLRTNAGWKAAYRAAIFERNKNVIALRISDAEEAIVTRTRELFQETGPEAEVERDDLDDALYALRALRSAEENTTAA